MNGFAKVFIAPFQSDEAAFAILGFLVIAALWVAGS